MVKIVFRSKNAFLYERIWMSWLVVNPTMSTCVSMLKRVKNY